MIPKTEIEFRANLGTMVSKSIELKNPSSKAITYDVTIEGSLDFHAKGTEVCIMQLLRYFCCMLGIASPASTKCSWYSAPTFEQEHTLNQVIMARARLAAATARM